MKVTRLEAHKVHGYLPIHVDFFPDLTFLTGLNGSGKTTALRLLMGLLAPNLDDLIDISFTTVSATISDGVRETTLQAIRSQEGLVLTTSEVQETLSLGTAELQLLVEARHHPEEGHIPLHQKLRANPVYQAVAKMSTPMFLGLDRRLYVDAAWERQNRRRFRDIERRHFLHLTGGRVDTAELADVNELVAYVLARIRASQEQLDANLRNQILLDSFRYETTTALKTPNRKTLEQFRARLAAVENAAAGLGLDMRLLESALADFVERMTKVVDAVEKKSERAGPKKQAAARNRKASESLVSSWPVFEWTMNAAQANRIFKQVELFEKYVVDRAKLHEPIDRFLELANGFLVETNKSIRLTDQGRINVDLKEDDKPRSLTALSSGEKQIVVMLAHLSLNENLSDSGVFIIDEPELSLHISWQERFVDAIQRANPNVQLIMATHSPAIILDKLDNCRSLS
jgi:predicted ATPase